MILDCLLARLVASVFGNGSNGGMMEKTVCVLGGTGFVGTHLVGMLSNRGYNIRVPTRNIERHRALKVLPNAELVECNIGDDEALAEVITGADVVINLVGILNESKHQSFKQVHVELPRRVAETCLRLGVPRLLHMSALHADKRGSSRYLQTKGRGEDIVHELGGDKLAVTSFRPSTIFGEGDGFLNLFARLIRLAPGMLPLACADARLQPVYVGDVCKVFADALEDEATHGKRIDLCGPQIYTLRELVEYTAKLTGKSIRIWALPDWLARMEAGIMEWMPGKPFTMDNYRSLQTDSVCPRSAGLCPTALEAIAPKYLGLQDREGLNQKYRSLARRVSGVG